MSGSARNRPNILWISSHDTSARNYGCYGDTYSRTPNIDRLASQGIRYTNAFTVGPICSPSRVSIYTGMHPTTLGTHHHRSAVIRPPEVELLPKMLLDAGYACTRPDQDLNLYVTREEYESFLDSDDFWESRSKDRPFFACFKLGSAHASVFKLTPEEARSQRSNLLDDDELHDAEKAPVPSFVPDTPLFRERMALFYDAITNVDKQVGEILDKLEAEGLSEDTIVAFWADHGAGYPRGKIHAYDDGLHIPLILRFPSKYRHLAPRDPGSKIHDLVLHMDLAPTILHLAGISIPEQVQGRTLCGPNYEPREYVCSARDRLDNNPEMIRTIRTHRYRYIRNFLPDHPYASFYPDGGFFSPIPEDGTPERDFWETSCLPGEQKLHDPDGVFLMYDPPLMVRGQGFPDEYRQYLVWQDHKPHEELYDIQGDLESIHNLADDPGHLEIKQELREELYKWMIDTDDLGLLEETEICERAAKYNGVSREVGLRCDNFPRILETADLPRLGEDGRQELLLRLTDPDSAVRYWAATGLRSYDTDTQTVEGLLPLLDDASISVSLAAAECLVSAGEGSAALAALTRCLEHEILWARLRAGAYLSYCTRDQLRPLKSLIEVLRSAEANSSMFGPEHKPHIETHQFDGMLDVQRDVIAKRWVLERTRRRIELA